MVYVLLAFNRARRGVILCQFPYERHVNRARGALLGKGYYASLRAPAPYRVWRRSGRLRPRHPPFRIRGGMGARWQRDSLVINPPIDVPLVEPDSKAKEKVIVSVGRLSTGHTSRRRMAVALLPGVRELERRVPPA